jgi:dephospho-CoA kinase
VPDRPGAGSVPFVGLTGGIGAGKSTALEALAELGARTLSADAVVHELLGVDEIREAIVGRLGEEFLTPAGAVDRAAVAARIFDRPEDRAWLEGMLWPRVGARVAEWQREVAELQPPPPVAVVEVPLLFEAGMEGAFDATIAVVADEPLRAARAEARGHAAVAERAGRQLTQAEKAQRADYAVRNDGTREELKAELSRVLATIRA